jgi:hypothetical protein
MVGTGWSPRMARTFGKARLAETLTAHSILGRKSIAVATAQKFSLCLVIRQIGDVRSSSHCPLSVSRAADHSSRFSRGDS